LCHIDSSPVRQHPAHRALPPFPTRRSSDLVAVSDAEIQVALASAKKEAAFAELPVYRQNAAYASEHGELEQYRVSHQANIACKEAIEQSIDQNYDGRRLAKGTADKVMQKFGTERVMYVLANTIQQKGWDGRFHPYNKDWARTVDIPPNPDSFGFERNCEFVRAEERRVGEG